MRKVGNNYAFIDSQNVNLAIRRLGWKLDWRRFRVYLAEKYIVTGDGDFYCLVKHWIEHDKLERILIPNYFRFSALLKRFGKKRVDFMNDLRGLLEYKKRTP